MLPLYPPSGWTGQGGGVTAGAGGQDPGADTGGGSSVTTGVAAGAGCNILGSWTP
jgi:hypothetical protein